MVLVNKTYVLVPMMYKWFATRVLLRVFNKNNLHFSEKWLRKEFSALVGSQLANDYSDIMSNPRNDKLRS